MKCDIVVDAPNTKGGFNIKLPEIKLPKFKASQQRKSELKSVEGMSNTETNYKKGFNVKLLKVFKLPSFK